MKKNKQHDYAALLAARNKTGYKLPSKWKAVFSALEKRTRSHKKTP